MNTTARGAGNWRGKEGGASEEREREMKGKKKTDRESMRVLQRTS